MVGSYAWSGLLMAEEESLARTSVKVLEAKIN